MLEQIEALKARAQAEIENIQDPSALEVWRVRYLGKKSELTVVLRGLAELSIEEKKAVGSAANSLKVTLEAIYQTKEQSLRESRVLAEAAKQTVDITLPGRRPPLGHQHPITQTIQEICSIFGSMGFQVVQGPEVELEYYNFDALNIPEGHPSRDKMSSSWIDYTDENGKHPMLLRTHNTCVTARMLASMKTAKERWVKRPL